MLLSMTGFGRGECGCGRGGVLAVQLSAVNRKQLELRCSLPAELAAAEVNARRIVAQSVSRGSVQLRCSFSVLPEPCGSFRVNTALLDGLIRESRAARVRANLSPDVAVERLMALPGVLMPAAQEEDNGELVAAFETALRNALDDFNAMRRKEGEHLANDLLARLEKLEHIHGELSALSADYPEQAKRRLMERLTVEKLPVTADDPAMLRELLFYVDRGDVTEELTRLSSHFRQFRDFLAAETAVGRNLDFLAQEMFREITTFGNKSAVPAASPLVVEFKAEMEKIREQIQNIE